MCGIHQEPGAGDVTEQEAASCNVQYLVEGTSQELMQCETKLSWRTPLGVEQIEQDDTPVVKEDRTHSLPRVFLC